MKGDVQAKAASAVLGHVSNEKYMEEGSERDTLVKPKKIPRDPEIDLLHGGDRYAYLDLTRISAVVCVAIDHGASEYGEANSLFTQNWVLQFLYLVAGISFCLSHKSTSQYLIRLGIYVVIGVCINLVAWIIVGLNWKDNIFNVVFQFWFVVGLMIYCLVLAPVKHYLRGMREAPCHIQLNRFFTWSLMVGGPYLIRIVARYCIVGLLLYVFNEADAGEVKRIRLPNGIKHWLKVEEPADVPPLLIGLARYLSVSVSGVYLAVVGPLILAETSWLSWYIMANMYVERLIFYNGSEERPFHALDLVTLAVVCYYMGMAHRKRIADFMTRYWMVFVLTCGLLWPPTLHVRLDERPTESPYIRFRYVSIEVILVIFWLTAGERMVDPRIFSEDKLGFLGDWALLVFLVHKACHIMLWQPWNWMFLLALAPICYLCARLQGKA